MKWFRVEKENGVQPRTGDYTDWKEILAEEGRHQCVYCAIPEASFGGIRNFHVEHYKPKGIPRFSSLMNKIENLFYACPICNTFKGEDWPCDPPDNLMAECYADPSTIDYTYLFLPTNSIELVGVNIAARYMIVKLYLNRPQLIMERRQEIIYQNLKHAKLRFEKDIDRLIERNDVTSRTLLRQYLRQISQLDDLKDQAYTLVRYTNKDVSR